MNRQKNIVIFDFDGVVADTLDVAYNINQKINPNLKKADYLRRFEGNINDHADTDIKDSFIDFVAEFSPQIQDQQIVTGISQVIEQLKQNHTLVIVTSNFTGPIMQFLTKHNLEKSFDQVLDNDVATSKVDKFNMIFDQYNVTASETVMITDTLGDLREANEVNIPTIAVTWGFHDEATLQKGNPTHIINSPDQILSVIEVKVRKS